MYQPIFLLSDVAIINDRVGDELEKTSYAFNSLYQMGAPVSLALMPQLKTAIHLKISM